LFRHSEAGVLTAARDRQFFDLVKRDIPRFRKIVQEIGIPPE
jgi:hypothetical protein